MSSLPRLPVAAQVLGIPVFVVCTGLAALRHLGSSQIRDQIQPPALAGGVFILTEPPERP